MRSYKPKEKREMGQIDYGIFYTLCILLSIGVVMVYSTSSFYAMFIITIVCISLKGN